MDFSPWAYQQLSGSKHGLAHFPWHLENTSGLQASLTVRNALYSGCILKDRHNLIVDLILNVTIVLLWCLHELPRKHFIAISINMLENIVGLLPNVTPTMHSFLRTYHSLCQNQGKVEGL